MFKTIRNSKGEAYVGEAVKIVVAIVLGAALLAGLVLIANKVILPKTQDWIERMFTSTDKYVGSIEDEALGLESKWGATAVLNMSNSTFYNKWKDDPDIGEFCFTYYGLLYGGDFYGADRDELKAMVEEEVARDPNYLEGKEKEFYYDWVAEFDDADRQLQDPKANDCSSEMAHYSVEWNNGEITDQEYIDKCVASADKYGYDGEAVRAFMTENM